jgi:hypothetical protein
MWLIAAFRIAAALPVLRWPLAGAFIAVFADLADLFLREWLDLGGVNDYQRFDKLLDQAYMITFLIVALRWEAAPRNIAVALFAYREIGVIAFEISDERAILLLFPNIFEYWFIFVAALKHFGWEEQRAKETPPTPLGGSGSLTGEGAPSDHRSQAQATSPAEPQLSLTPDLHPTRHSALSTLHAFLIPYRNTLPQLAAAFAVILAAKLFHEYTLHVGQWFESFTPSDALAAIWEFLTPPY